MINAQQVQYQLVYEISPIMLVNGIASNGQYLPIIQITDPDTDFDNDYGNAFAHFRPMQNSSLIDNDIGDYPFANQTVAANAVITRPLKVSLTMTCVAQTTGGGYPGKLAKFTNLIQQLNLHIQAGGTFIVATPSYIYNSCLLVGLHDVSRMDINQPQNTWQWDFVQPLLTLQAAQVAYNSLMSRIAGMLPNSGTWSGPGSTIGSSQPVMGPAQIPGIGNITAPSGQTVSA